MSKLVTVAMATLSVLALSTAFAQAGNNGTISTNPGLKIRPVLSCDVAGTPNEFPDDIYITNKGVATAVKGTVVHWSVPFAGKSGNYTLGADLKAGKSVFVSGVLPGGVEAGKPCAASI